MNKTRKRALSPEELKALRAEAVISVGALIIFVVVVFLTHL